MTPKILLVDDIPEYLEAMELYLPEDCSVTKATSARSARRLIEAELPTLAVLDVRLKDDDPRNRDGLELLRWIKEQQLGVRVIMLSAYQGFEFEIESLALGAEYFLRKPLKPDEFRQAVQSVLGKA